MNRLFPVVVIVCLLLVVGGVAAAQGPPDGEECTNDKSGKSSKLPDKAADKVNDNNPNVDCTDGEEDGDGEDGDGEDGDDENGDGGDGDTIESLHASVSPEPAWATEPVTITITDQDGNPVSDAKIDIESFGAVGPTDENGEATFDAPDVGGETTLEAVAYKGDASVEFTVTVRPQPDVLAVHAGVSDGTVTVLVRDFDEVQNRSGFRDLGVPVPGVSVSVDGSVIGETDQNGEVTFDAPDVDRDTVLQGKAEKGDVDRTFWVTIRPESSAPQTWYEDWDGDGYGNQEVTKEAVQQPFGFVATDESGRLLIDCNDNDADLQENCDDPDDDDGFDEDPP